MAKKFTTRPTFRDKKAGLENTIIDNLKSGRTYVALQLSIESFSKNTDMVDFIVDYARSSKFKSYRTGLTRLQDAIIKHRTGDVRSLEVYLETTRTNSFTISKFDTFCINVVKIEQSKEINKDILDKGTLALTSLEDLDLDQEEEIHKKAHTKIVVNILAKNFNNETMKVLYGI